jgi:hypothetical protein
VARSRTAPEDCAIGGLTAGGVTALPVGVGTGGAVPLAAALARAAGDGGSRAGPGAAAGWSNVGTSTRGGGAVVGSGWLALGVGVGARRREAGTSGATGPWTSVGGSCCGRSPGRRNPFSEATAGEASAAADRASTEARVFERIGRPSRLGRTR